jgi:hypothetical protein
MMKRLYTILALLFFLSNLPVLAQASRSADAKPREQEPRTALVIGNGNYSNAPLNNPANDAVDMSAALKTLGFEVLAYTDVSQNEMKKAVRDFGAKLRAKGGVGLFYYAGHGIQSRGANYLIPIGAKIGTEEEIEYESVEVGLVLAQMESAGNEMNIVILDACRNNPFVRSSRSTLAGLASIDAPSGSLLAYATAPGSVASDGTGRNGLYTQELLKAIRTNGLSIEDVFKRVRVSVRSASQSRQTPWESSSLTGNFYFTKPGKTNATFSPPKENSSAPTIPEKRPEANLENFARVMNSAFAKGFEKKSVKTKVQFIAAGQTENYLFGAIPADLLKDKVPFRVSAPGQDIGSETPFGSIPPHVFIDKAKSDLIFDLKKGDFLILSGSTVVGTMPLGNGQNFTQIVFIADSIEKATR